ncbi:hypothetical protein AALO_G00129510 [Alosa alosa]|uniref:Uncharacterized protein n=1 Tax=Alosa alosa TaxID=278164 RepID=A0AAV6GRA8_9TELE|nr:hypothetical protein AALO_G00129510 [Alosa alosa]
MQYNHDMKRKEREYYKLKEHLNQLLIDKKDNKQAIEVLNCVGRSDGRRGQWKTRKTEARHEEEMYQTLLNDFDNRQRELMLENVELRKVLQQIKKEMISILSPKQSSWREVRQEHCENQDVGSDEEVVCESGRDSLEQSCEQAKEELTNSIRQQWRKLKHHVEKLDSQVSLGHIQQKDSEVMAIEAHDKEMDQLRQEIQQCKDFIHTQQQLLQRKLFEEDRGTWLKHQFLNLSFADHVNQPLSKSTGVLSEYVEVSPAPSSLSDVLSQMVFSPPEGSSVRPSSSADYQQTHLPQSRF